MVWRVTHLSTEGRVVLKLKQTSGDHEEELLERVERQIVEASRPAFVQVADLLARIKRERLFRSKGYSTFGNYLRDSEKRLGFGARQAQYLLAARKVVNQLTNHSQMPTSERQVSMQMHLSNSFGVAYIACMHSVNVSTCF